MIDISLLYTHVYIHNIYTHTQHIYPYTTYIPHTHTHYPLGIQGYTWYTWVYLDILVYTCIYLYILVYWYTGIHTHIYPLGY